LRDMGMSMIGLRFLTLSEYECRIIDILTRSIYSSGQCIIGRQTMWWKIRLRWTWTLSYPNFVWGRSFVNICILANRIKLLNTNCHAIRRVLWRFKRKCAKYSKEGQKGHFWGTFGGIFQPVWIILQNFINWIQSILNQSTLIKDPSLTSFLSQR